MPEVQFLSNHEELYSYLLTRLADDYGFSDGTQISNRFCTTVSTENGPIQLHFFDWHADNLFKHHPHLCILQLPLGPKKFYLRRISLPHNSRALMESDEALEGLYDLLRCHYFELDKIIRFTRAASYFEGGLHEQHMQCFFNSEDAPGLITLKQLVKPFEDIEARIEPAGQNIKLASYAWINPELYLAERRLLGASELTADVVSQFGQEPEWLGAMYSYCNFVFKRFEGRFHSVVLESPSMNALIDLPWALEWLELDYDGRQKFRSNLLHLMKYQIIDLLHNRA